MRTTAVCVCRFTDQFTRRGRGCDPGFGFRVKGLALGSRGLEYWAQWSLSVEYTSPPPVFAGCGIKIMSCAWSVLFSFVA
jgi:hypothetical protein